MAGRIELESDIAIKLGEPAYYSIAGNEVSDMSAMPYFCGKFPMKVKLNLERNTVLKFKVGGITRKEIRGQVTRPGNIVTSMFCINEANGKAWEVEKNCKVVIRESDADDVGRWSLTIWYKGKPNARASSRRTVNE